MCIQSGPVISVLTYSMQVASCPGLCSQESVSLSLPWQFLGSLKTNLLNSHRHVPCMCCMYLKLRVSRKRLFHLPTGMNSLECFNELVLPLVWQVVIPDFDVVNLQLLISCLSLHCFLKNIFWNMNLWAVHTWDFVNYFIFPTHFSCIQQPSSWDLQN